MKHFTAPPHPNNFSGPHFDGTIAAQDDYPVFREGGLLDVDAANAARETLTERYSFNPETGEHTPGGGAQVHDYDNPDEYLRWYEIEYRRGYTERALRIMQHQAEDSRRGGVVQGALVIRITGEPEPVAIGAKRNFAGRRAQAPFMLTCVKAGDYANVDDETNEVLETGYLAFWAYLG